MFVQSINNTPCYNAYLHITLICYAPSGSGGGGYSDIFIHTKAQTILGGSKL